MTAILGRLSSRLGGLARAVRDGIDRRRRARPFDRRGGATRALVLFEDRRISLAQIHPFQRFAESFRRRRGVDLRFLPNAGLIDGSAARLGAPDIVLLQTWFDWDGDRLAATFDAIRGLNHDVRIIFIDSFAPNDLRLAQHVDPHVTFYLKKTLFRDESMYLMPFMGDSNLEEYYRGRYGLSAEVIDWRTPPSVLPKLRLSPGFFTAPALMPLFDTRAPPPPPARRRIDVHARMETSGSDWYSLMRRESLRALGTAPGIKVTTDARVSWADFMGELRDARLCLSCFGYGEMCWRDSEAQAAGSVLVKQDMSHLRTAPDLYVAGETYAPVRWDFSDLAEVIAGLLADPDRQERMARVAFDRVATYLAEERFVDDMAPLFE